jgi:hypothetical protein
MRSLTLPPGQGDGGFSFRPDGGEETAMCSPMEFFPRMMNSEITKHATRRP